MRPRAVGILLNDHHEVLLILRRKAGREYATLPGGGIEGGETPAQACAREFLEEVNLIVEVGPPVFRLQARGDDDHYFQVSYRSGEMRLGDGPDAPPHSEDNHYDPQWVSVDRLEDVNFVPSELRDVVRGLARANPLPHTLSASGSSESPRRGTTES
ncbi:NUDIX domain-containing protein [Deinococcus koreensis]|uniref:DNA mismatch repair protein MutT n=1 Tax=Deinococcus koreensis TaxID=2054903 RepID=A0A2K3UZJ3_9DEIO|nr:NUDIX domain-containing protein [Deinococcus koreensis]PNY81954.1 DNA mismatch repair protein MutT [Deinococcus koreensis]